MHSRERIGMALMVPALMVIATFLVYPIASAIVTSFYIDDGFRTEFVGLKHYRDLAGDTKALDTLGFTFLFVFVSVALEIVLGLLVALVIHRSFRGRGIVRAAVLVPWAIPTAVVAIMWRYMFDGDFGVVNLVLFGNDTTAYRNWLVHTDTARLAIILADVWKTTAFAALLMLAGLQSIPDDLYEAARVDGAGPGRRFWHITLPMLRPAILLAVLFRLMDAFRVFDLVWVMTGGHRGTDVLQRYGFEVMIAHGQFGKGSAISVVVFLIVGLFAVVTIRLIGRRALEKP